MAIITRRNDEGKRIASLQQAMERAQVAQTNAEQARREREGGQEAQQRASVISASGQAAAASMRAGQAATQSQRLLVEFEAGLAQKQALQRRQSAQAVGQSVAGFGASGVVSAGAALEAQRQAALEGNIGASSANSQREQILGSARDAITGALATGISAGASVAASFQRGPMFTRAVERQVGAVGQKDYIKEGIGVDRFYNPDLNR